jgi:hypothetical protein
VNPRAVQEGLAAAGRAIAGLQCLPALTDAIDPPTLAPSELEFQYNLTFQGGGVALTEAMYTVGLFVSRGDTDEGRSLLVDYLAPSGASSVKAALEADRTLGGAAKTLIVERVRGAYRIYTIGATDLLGALIDVRVWA